MVVKKCGRCNKDISLKTECEEEGVAYHAPCFRCCFCNRFLSEYDVIIRGKDLFCGYHGKFIPGFQPFCKIYFNDTRTCYRVIYAGDKSDGNGEEEEEEDEGEGR